MFCERTSCPIILPLIQYTSKIPIAKWTLYENSTIKLLQMRMVFTVVKFLHAR